MTLILTYASTNGILQVSDRRLTGGKRIYDEIANKAVLYQARDGFLVISYTGLAFIPPQGQGTLVDEWIAEQLTHRPISRDSEGKPHALSVFNVRPWASVGQALQLLRDRLNDAASSMPPYAKTLWRDEVLRLCTCGWIWNKRDHYRPFAATVDKARRSFTAVLTWAPRYWYVPLSGAPARARAYFDASPDGYLSKADLAAVEDRLSTASTADAVENHFVEQIRTVSRSNIGVGPDCMSIVVPPPSIATAWVRFRPGSTSQHNVSVIARNRKAELHPVSFIPWLVGPTGAAAPAIVTGAGIQRTVGGRYRIHVHAPPARKNGILGVLDSHQRLRL